MAAWKLMDSKGKYKNRRVLYDGIWFDSLRELDRWKILEFLEKCGKIKGLRRQVRYRVIPTQRGPDGKVAERAAYYVADFVYEKGGETVVEDAKGVRTPEYVLKRKLMLHLYGIRIREV